ncbi:MAG: DUF692 domain-containing protein [Blastocatellia bacterium]|nr:DUF692 domain-containing protein [Blastocatellia bacterium]
MQSFTERIVSIPRLGVGLSGEYGSSAKGIDPNWLKENHPEIIHFFEFGGDIDRGLDEYVRKWVSQGLPTTYHFLDVNLEEAIDLDAYWLDKTLEMAQEINAAWLCGDAGRWHFGPRERGHHMLMPPILCRESALETIETIRRLQAESRMLCVPENPPSVMFLGDMHMLDYFALVTEGADCGMLLDCAHLSIFQHSRGLEPLTGLADFPLERVVEIHVAGGAPAEVEGFGYLDDTHSPEPVEATWQILDFVLPRAKNLKAIVYECEHNLPEACLQNFEKLNRLFPA